MRRRLTLTYSVELDDETWQAFAADLVAGDPEAQPVVELAQALGAQIGPAPWAVLAAVPGVEVLEAGGRVQGIYDEEREF